MKFQRSEAVALLERTPAVLRSLMVGLPDAWVSANEGPDTFSPREVVAHLIHGERTDWIPRVRRILEDGESVAFDPFDRRGHAARGVRSVTELLDEFEALRGASLAQLRELVRADDALDRTGRHPAFGRVTLRELLAAWVVHDLTHLAQIARVMARRYEGDVGPWVEYLGILQWRR